MNRREDIFDSWALAGCTRRFARWVCGSRNTLLREAAGSLDHRRTRRDASASILTALAGIAVDKSVHGVAFPSWNQHPEPTRSRWATPLLLFQQWPGPPI